VISRLLVCVVAAWLGLHHVHVADARAAKVPVCGSEDAEGNTILGTLALNDNSSTVKSYGMGTGERSLSLLYDVTGCVLPAGTTIEPEQVSILAAKTGADLPSPPAVTVGVGKPTTTAVAVTVKIKLDSIGAGVKGGIARVQVPEILHDSFTPISVSRTDSFLWPVLLGFCGAIAGLIWALGLHFARSVDCRFDSKSQWTLLIVLTFGAGLVAGYGSWDNQEVWTWHDNAWATVATGFAASTTGALAGVSAALRSPTRTAGHGK
jgi:hypothetical protein